MKSTFPPSRRLWLAAALAAILHAPGFADDGTPVLPLAQAAGTAGLLVGSAVAYTPLFNDAQYAQVLAREFSQITCETEMKFKNVQPGPSTFDFSKPDAMVSFALGHQMKVRGHTLVWYSPTQIPAWIPGTMTQDQLSATLSGHIAAEVGHYQGQVYAWDVVNEAFNPDGSMRPSVWYDSPGIGFAGQGTKYIEQAFRWARAADPNALLFYNDYGAEGLNAKSDAVYAMVRDFKARGVPIDGVGLQAHLQANGISTADLASNISRLTSLGVQVQITELDVALALNQGVATAAQLAGQAQIYHDVIAACAANPGCTAVTVWEFTDKYSWIPKDFPGMGAGDLFDMNISPKPAYGAAQAAFANQ